MAEAHRDSMLILATEWTALPKPKKGWRFVLKVADMGLVEGDLVKVIGRGSSGLQLHHGDAVCRAIDLGGVQRLTLPVTEQTTLTFLVSVQSKQAAPEFLAMYVIRAGRVSACADALLPRCGARSFVGPRCDPGEAGFQTDMADLSEADEGEMVARAARAMLVSTEDSTALAVATQLGRSARHQTPNGLIDLMLHLGSAPTKNPS